MTRRLALLALALLFCAGAGAQEGKVPAFSLDIIHLNDTHKMYEPSSVPFTVSIDGTARSGFLELGGFDRDAEVIGKLRAEAAHPLVLHAGDVLGRKYGMTAYATETDAAVWNAVGIDASALGNNDLKEGIDQFIAWQKSIDWPVLAVNSGDPYARRLGKDYPKPYLVKEYGKERVGVIGVPTIGAAAASGLVQGCIDELEAQGVDKIVVLSHLGLDQDEALAALLQGADVIVGGHSHSVLGSWPAVSLGGRDPYPILARGKDGEPTLIVQAYEYGKVVGHLRVDFDGSGKVAAWEGSPLLIVGTAYFRLDNLSAADGSLVNVEFLQSGPVSSVRVQPQLESFRAATAAEAAFFLPWLAKLKEALSRQPGVSLCGGSPAIRAILAGTQK